jgi:hypothetical protein
MFTTARDLESSGDASQAAEAPAEAVDARSKERHTQERTALELIASKRKSILQVIGKKYGIPLIAKGRALFWSADHKLRVACSISKRYDRAEPYWYAYHPNWDAFLADGETAHFALGCVDLDIAFVIPRKVIAENIQFLSTSTRENGMTYWHIKITEHARDGYGLHVQRG